MIVWIGSGLIFPHHKSESHQIQGKLDKLKIQNFSFVEKAMYIDQNGITEPKTFASIKTETDGRVIELLSVDGAKLKKGDPVIKLDERDHKTNLDKAESTLSQKQINYKAAEAVFKKGLSSKNALADAESQLKTAEASLLQAQIALQNTTVRAPFDGILDHIIVHEGDFLRSGETVTTFIELDPMIIVAYISEHDVSLIDKTQEAISQFKDKEEIRGEITFLSNVSDKNTRSFRLEVTIPNKNGSVLSGETVNLRVPIGLKKLHKLPNIALTLDSSGALQVKTVTKDNVVKSWKIEIVEEEVDGIWVKGLPDSVDVILMGQSFVSDGESLTEKL